MQELSRYHFPIRGIEDISKNIGQETHRRNRDMFGINAEGNQEWQKHTFTMKWLIRKTKSFHNLEKYRILKRVIQENMRRRKMNVMVGE